MSKQYPLTVLLESPNGEVGLGAVGAGADRGRGGGGHAARGAIEQV